MGKNTPNPFINNSVQAYLKDISKVDYRRGFIKTPNSTVATYYTHEEEKELYERYLNGDNDAREALIESQLKLVVKVVKLIMRKYRNPKMTEDDLIGFGNLGIQAALESYDPKKGRFPSWVQTYSYQTVMKALKEHSRTIRLPVNKISDLTAENKQRQLYMSIHGRKPSDGEPYPNNAVYEEGPMKGEPMCFGMIESTNTTSMNDVINEDGDEKGDFIGSEPEYDTKDNSMRDSYLKDCVGELPFRWKEIIDMKYYKGLKNNEIAHFITPFEPSDFAKLKKTGTTVLKVTAKKGQATLEESLTFISYNGNKNTVTGDLPTNKLFSIDNLSGNIINSDQSEHRLVISKSKNTLVQLEIDVKDNKGKVIKTFVLNKNTAPCKVTGKPVIKVKENKYYYSESPDGKTCYIDLEVNYGVVMTSQSVANNLNKIALSLRKNKVLAGLCHD